MKSLLQLLLFSSAWFASCSNAATINVVDAKGQPVTQMVFSWTTDNPVDVSATPVIVDQIDRQFVPHISAIQAGQSVDFPNSDNIRHHVYSFSASNPFEIKLYRNRPAAPILFANPGVVALGCNIHDRMIGYIFVADANRKTALTDEQGTVQVPDVKQVDYWHPRLSLTGTEVRTLQLSGEANQTITVELTPDPLQDSDNTFGSGTFGSD